MFVLLMNFQRSLLTKDMLSRFDTVTDGKCLFCGDPESCDHLFFVCRDTNHVWRQLLNWMHIMHTPHDWKAGLNWIIEATEGKSCRAKLLKLCLAEMTYHVWLLRNKKAFQPHNEQELDFCVIKDVVLEHANLDRKLWDYCNHL